MPRPPAAIGSSSRARATGPVVDPSADAVAFCHDRGLDDVRQAGIEALPFGPDEFELVLALDVLEAL